MEWTVATSAGECGTCRRSFTEREEYYSVIFSSGEEFERKDYCAGCWQGSPENAFSFWRTQAKVKPAPPRRFVDDSVLLDFFERLGESEDESKKRFQFIMAVLLLRKRLLKERSRRRDENGVIWLVEVPRLGKQFEVRDQGLSEPEIAEVLGQMGQVLNIELSADTPAES